MKRICTCILVILALSGLMEAACAEGFAPGTYTGSAMGFGGPIELQVEVSAEEIVSVHVGANNETLGIGSRAVESLPAAMVEQQTADVEAVSGATVTSKALVFAANYALALARGENPQADPALAVEPQKTVYEEGWSAQPQPGLLKGNYYYEE